VHSEVILNITNAGKRVSLLYFYMKLLKKKNKSITMFTIFIPALLLLDLGGDIFHMPFLSHALAFLLTNH